MVGRATGNVQFSAFPLRRARAARLDLGGEVTHTGGTVMGQGQRMAAPFTRGGPGVITRLPLLLAGWQHAAPRQQAKAGRATLAEGLGLSGPIGKLNLLA